MPTMRPAYTSQRPPFATCVRISPAIGQMEGDMHGSEPLTANALVRKLSGYIALSDHETGLLLHASAAPREIDGQRDLIREGDRPGPVFVMI